VVGGILSKCQLTPASLTPGQVFDVLPKEAGEAKVKTYHPERAFYFKVDISNVDLVFEACSEALKVIPKGSLAGGVHCAAVATSRKWSNKLKDSVAVSRNPPT
jgi:3-hydroxyacyl-CoA dehydrogenase